MNTNPTNNIRAILCLGGSEQGRSVTKERQSRHSPINVKSETKGASPVGEAGLNNLVAN